MSTCMHLFAGSCTTCRTWGDFAPSGAAVGLADTDLGRSVDGSIYPKPTKVERFGQHIVDYLSSV